MHSLGKRRSKGGKDKQFPKKEGENKERSLKISLMNMKYEFHKRIRIDSITV